MLLCTSALVIYILFFFGSLITDAPLVLARSSAVTQIIDALRLNNNSIFYDLGCGNGRILIASLSQNPKKAIGLEYSPLAFMWAKINTRKNTQIQIIRANILTSNIHQATHIFVYLFPKAMGVLETRFNSQLQKGTRVVSCDFTFPHKEAKEVIDISTPESKLAQKLYVYEW